MKKLKYKRDEEYIFVDGYNIINFWDTFKMDEDLESQRDKLINILIEYSHVVKEKIILVFDGYLVKKSPGTIYKKDGITIVFTKEFETADHFIEKELHLVGRVRNIRVATSDNIEQQIILAKGGSRISAREFEIEVNNAMTKINKEVSLLKENSKNISNLDDKNRILLENLKKKIK
ncbi:MAG: NYN domain-containing protein [Peptoniphilaceae bacterium]